jgi:hypothetical protein
METVPVIIWDFTFCNPLEPNGFRQLYFLSPKVQPTRLTYNSNALQNIGRLEQQGDTDKLVLVSTQRIGMASIEGIWCTRMVDYLDLGEPSDPEGMLQCQCVIYCSMYCDRFGFDSVVASIEWSPDEQDGVNQETRIYSLIQGHNIGPRFLAHITENGKRVIGYLAEGVPGRAAAAKDLEACHETLSRFHSLGIAHGCLRSTNFIVTDDQVVLHGFEASYETTNKDVLNAEMGSLKDILDEVWMQEEPLSEDLNNQLIAINKRDNGIHPAIIDQAVREGKITYTETEHKAMLLEFQQTGGAWKPMGVS